MAQATRCRVLQGKPAGAKVGKLTAEQAEIARLKRENARLNKRLTSTEAALEIMGKAHALLSLSESAEPEHAETALMDAWKALRAQGIPTRAAAELTGMNRSTALRRSARKPSECTAAVTVPVNKLTAAECARVLDELNSARFVDCAPLQVWATLLDEGTYLCSVSTMYRILTANKQVRSVAGWPGTARRSARSWWPPPRGRCTPGTSPNSRPGQGDLLRRLRDDRHLLALHRRVHVHARECGCWPPR